jgi:phosphatidylethanolamine/phosphatidyl-N-methylethanolamine N-methyltransferase
MHLDSVKAAYRRYARIYDTLFGPVLQPGRRAVIGALELRPGDRVLEVGVGTGLSLPLYPQDVAVTGIDVSLPMLQKARERTAQLELENVEALLEMDAQAMKFANASFDKVVAMYVVSVVEDPARLLEELHRVCRPDGEIFIVNHVRSEHPILGAFEKGLARFSDRLGWHPDFEMRQILDGSQGVDDLGRVNFLWKVMRLRNGIARAPRASA